VNVLRTMMVVLSVVLIAGCANWRAAAKAWFEQRQDPLLVRADRELAAERYDRAVALYDEFLQLRADDPAANRARATRAVLVKLLDAQRDLERARAAQAAGEQALADQQRELAERQRELDTLKAGTDRVRAEREFLRAEADRAKADRDRLRDALERLRTIDLGESTPRPSDRDRPDLRR
jgi:chromosome segregation ATPase